MRKRWGATGTVVIPQPIEVDELMHQVPKGKLTTINHIRRALAKKHLATICCPLTAGIFVNIAAHAAHEQTQQGQEDTTPYWRTLKKGGIINPKYPATPEEQKKRLEHEGHIIIKKGKNYQVRDYQQHLITFQ